MRPSWIIHMGPNSNDECPYERKKKNRWYTGEEEKPHKDASRD